MLELTNGQECPASFDLFDQKDQPFESLPAGATVEFSSSDEGVAQWKQDPDAANKGTITTLTDKVGTATISGKLTLADGTVFTGAIDVAVTHSAAGSARFSPGQPVAEA